MKLHKLKADLDALHNNQALFEESQFNARKEALNFIAIIEEIFASRDPEAELVDLYEQAEQLGDRIHTFNDALFQDLRNEILAGVKGEHLRDLLAPFTN